MEKFSQYIVSQSVSGGKFWEVEVEGNDLRIRYGKLGQDKKWAVRQFDDHAAALKEGQKKLNGKLRKGYAEAPRPSAVSSGSVVLANTSFTGVFYFRAFDRWPGGNADMFTLKLTLTCLVGQEPMLVGLYHRDYDGQHLVSDEAPVNLALDETAPALLDAAQNLIDADLREGTFSVLDGRADSDAYDTEWSSLEFTLTAVDSGVTLLRFNQKAVYKKQTPSAPDATSQAFLESVLALTGLGRVEAYADNKVPLSNAWSNQAESSDYIDGTPVPLYL